ncbi:MULTISPECIES: CBS and ACT domain-containing protein [Thermotoga]|jgi:acetoin utilization protein AcuB|uniref:CBS and ACT domain-containing protein n=1 Tax=Thermotoga TaxID=2335 RepID=UPI0001600BF2|nr:MULTISPECIES: CBS and ACT domain-containing protein [unclassified Thermotoga]MDK2893643.1 acetoin utilization protein AcuB [Thermotoga sp.]ACB10006.1 CBS domain containing membrane protein [Thermotoga sp. RQ2]AIY88908.1 CBS domain-containing protein [Thermotoga sp. Cell2]KHC91557.1 CBS domain-containing protein [Thermotoga sp. Mc24]KHC93074.1 CBS domain-containing protein [Thermotoga sp. TBGT1765]
MLVKDFMTRNPITIAPETSFSEALKLMKQNKIKRLIVMKDEKIVGIVTEKDLLYASPSKATTLNIWELHYLLSKLKIEEIMTKDVVTVNENTPIEDAARIMEEKDISGLPVVDDAGHLVGIITQTDIFKVFVEIFGTKREGTIRYTMEMPDKPGELLEVAKRIYEAGGNIISIATLFEEGKDSYLATLRVENIDHEKFVKSLDEIDVKLLYYHSN